MAYKPILESLLGLSPLPLAVDAGLFVIESIKCDDLTGGFLAETDDDEIVLYPRIDGLGTHEFLDALDVEGLTPLKTLIEKIDGLSFSDEGQAKSPQRVPIPFAGTAAVDVIESDASSGSFFSFSSSDETVGTVTISDFAHGRHSQTVSGDGGQYTVTFSVFRTAEALDSELHALLQLVTGQTPSSTGGLVEWALGLLGGAVGAAQASLSAETVDWRDVGHANDVHAMAGTDVLWAVTNDGVLWRRTPATTEVDWERIGAVAVGPVAASADFLWIASADNHLRGQLIAKVGAAWDDLGGATGVRAMTELGGTLWAATTDNGLWVRPATAEPSDWTRVGHANGVTALASQGGKLFAVTSDGVLWSRSGERSDVNWVKVGTAGAVVALASVGQTMFAATSENRLLVRK